MNTIIQAGLTSKAIDLAFRHERYSALAQIADRFVRLNELFVQKMIFVKLVSVKMLIQHKLLEWLIILCN